MRNVIVTGGSRGIGFVIARKLAASNYDVIVVARSEGDDLRQVMQCRYRHRGPVCVDARSGDRSIDPP
jgi:NAD(P)-dependent dehydrogenase (short-subunit alcohol dehydrogenase family)